MLYFTLQITDDLVTIHGGNSGPILLKNAFM